MRSVRWRDPLADVRLIAPRYKRDKRDKWVGAWLVAAWCLSVLLWWVVARP